MDNEPVSGGLLDLTLSVFHTAKRLLEKGKTPKYYVPKVEHHLEARWWNTLFTRLEEEMGLPMGSLRSTSSATRSRFGSMPDTQLSAKLRQPSPRSRIDCRRL